MSDQGFDDGGPAGQEGALECEGLRRDIGMERYDRKAAEDDRDRWKRRARDLALAVKWMFDQLDFDVVVHADALRRLNLAEAVIQNTNDPVPPCNSGELMAGPDAKE